jgi:protein-S-isoprenylcysteine O-methyltransferase Ste14
MSERDWALIAAVYLPISIAFVGALANKKLHRQFAACLVSFLWALPAVWVLQRMNEHFDWWSFGGPMPMELYAGWVVLWGLVPQLCFPRLGLAWCAAIMIAADLAGMPLCGAVLTLGPYWLLGEAVGAAIALVPALCLARWTLEDTHLPWRAGMQVAISAMLFLFLVPELAFALRPGAGWEPLLNLAKWQRQCAFQLVELLGLPGVAAVMEFAGRGGGTPIPYDPPKRLVRSGIYRYCANPMQLSCGVTMLAWAGLLRNGWLVLGACVSFVYSAGLAEWDEGEDLARRFGEDWQAYRAAVKSWVPRWRPYVAGPSARLYLAATCMPCSELRRWLEARGPAGLEILDAETLRYGSIRRMRYEADAGYSVDGVRAFGRALEHLHLGWALAGAALRLPVVWQFVQLLMDASGLGPRVVGHELPSESPER